MLRATSYELQVARSEDRRAVRLERRVAQYGGEGTDRNRGVVRWVRRPHAVARAAVGVAALDAHLVRRNVAARADARVGDGGGGEALPLQLPLQLLSLIHI